MQPSEADGTGHPRRFGYVRCVTCDHWRPLAETWRSFRGSECNDWEWCRWHAPPRKAAKLQPATPVGWDANGAPTGIDANGDAL